MGDYDIPVGKGGANVQINESGGLVVSVTSADGGCFDEGVAHIDLGPHQARALIRLLQRKLRYSKEARDA